ncbi:PPOX class F420-dependent oxidoreductase [Streptomyces sp. NPDC047108]|uniref:PPOX class F420-dependent oxidoreductase n=1 Tax=Streptomyces sp. NPDC047108 TaxID=3155025 RepID=UPI00340EB345
MAHTMTQDEWHAFVAEGTRTAKLSTVRSDGSPHVAPVWFVLDGDDLVLTTHKETVKGRNLLRDGRVAICVDDDRPPFSFVSIRGTADVSEDAQELLHWATRIAGRYMGADQAEAYGKRNAVPGELVVRVRVDRVVAQAALAE